MTFDSLTWYDEKIKEYIDNHSGSEDVGVSNYNDLTNIPTINGHEIKGTMTGEDLEIMDVEIYASPYNEGSVKKADAILGADEALIDTYYGKNTLGEVGFHYLPIAPSTTPETEQRFISPAIANQTYTITSLVDLSSCKLYIQCLKEIEGSGTTNSTLTIDEFTSANQDNYYYEDTIQFETNYVTLKDTTETVAVELDDSTSLYTSQEISKRNGLLTSISW